MNPSLFYALLVFASVIASPSMADHHESDSKSKPSVAKQITAEQIIQSLDKNNDQQLGLVEYILSQPKRPAGEVLRTFQQIDSNSDWRIDVKEAKAMADYANRQASPPPSKQEPASEQAVAGDRVTAAQIVTSMDKDGDDMIAKDEASAELRVYFTMYDADGNGKISEAEAEEIAAYVNGQTMTNNQTAVADSSKTGNASQKAKADGFIKFVDRDGDGKVSESEAPAELKPYFQNFDANADGFIDADEALALAQYF